MSNIKKKLISGVIWEAFGRYSALGIQFIVTIIIARILTPTEFGIIGLLTVFIALGQIFLDSGFSQALIQKKETSEVDLSSVYFLNMIVGILLYLILFFSSPFIAEFYLLPDLTNYARVVFLIIPINSFGLIQNVIIQKELAFKKTAMANMISALFSGIVGIGMAYSGFGVWALVGQQISLHSSRTLLYIIQMRWVPKYTISTKAIKELFAFSMNLMLHSVVNTTMKNIYALVIGKFFAVSQVGYYNQADKFQEISAGTISQVVLKVSFPALAQKIDEPLYLRGAYVKIFATTIFFVAPLMVFLMCVAEPLFRFLLTEKWLPAVPYFQILCIYGMLLPTLQISYNLYKLFKKGRFLLFIDSFRHLLVIISIFFTIKFGIEYMLFGLVLCTVVMTILNLLKSGALISLSLLDQLKSVFPYYLISGLVGVLVYFLPKFDSDILTVCFSGVIFISCYLLISKFAKLQGYAELMAFTKSIKTKIKK
ncbi:lipopolysaccharide biosynthesis protein [Sphingobacterium sp.]|uniref:lipopolysaccharide biosynthesis protein n=1 Tax=Sphingobacterium sp. TaxID=341027 RepID=UPI0031DDC0F2